MKGKSVAWDRPLTKQEVWNLSPQDKHVRLVTSIERKVLFLEDVVKRRHIPLHVIEKLAGSRTAFRKWQDIKLRLWKWSIVGADVVVDNKTGEEGPNYDLMIRWKNAMAALRTTKESTAVKEPDNSKLTTELARQNLALIARNAFLEAQLLKMIRSANARSSD
ncbi:hypothetical protein FHT77_001799 [Rhizobium sp. BK181]|uniref:hypothetical protein n=1 Tax=Rhizobium sp. BK181 TaxID=2587072 RepID=UPI0016155838|nr:hypothetical protein [Rhizobium sp. BK181]MBB3315934.1 hypothetical protein [Rhizobium sp. BK181]